MSIVGIVFENDSLIIAGDTRVIKPSRLPNEAESRFDFAVKIFEITDNILIGIVDDYKKSTIKLIKKIKKELCKTDVIGDFYWSYRHDSVVQKVSKILKEFTDSSQDVILAMHDVRNNKRYAYKFLKILNHRPYRIESIDFIGLNPQFHEHMKDIYLRAVTRNMPKNDEEYANSFLMSFKEIKDITINNHPICYVLHKEGRKTISNGTGYIQEDGSVDWVVNTLDNKGDWIRTVNGKYLGKIISDVDMIGLKLSNEYIGKPVT